MSDNSSAPAPIDSAAAAAAETKVETKVEVKEGGESKASRMPVWFLSHGGGPSFFMDGGDGMFKFMDQNSDACKWFKQLTKQTGIPKPKAIVVFSAHWETHGTISVTSQNKHSTLLYDYFGFPRHTYEIKYPAPGDKTLAAKIVSLIKAGGLKAEEDTKRNLDHGVFIPLKLIYPDADVPIVQVSLLDSLDPAQHIKMGKALASLRDEGVLLIGSGFATHSFQGKAPDTKAFMPALNEVLLKHSPEKREEALLNWEKLPKARACHPREEHLLPLHVVVGAASDGKGEKIGNFVDGAWALTSYSFQ